MKNLAWEKRGLNLELVHRRSERRTGGVGVSPADKKTRVLFVHSTLEIGGAEEVRLALLSSLDRSKFDATICCLQRGGEVAEEAVALGYEVIVLSRKAHALSLCTLWELRRLIRERRPHIVQTSLPRANYWGRIAAALERVPVIIAEEHTVSDKSDWARPVIERALGPHTDCAIAVSQCVAQAVKHMDQALAKRQTVVIPNPVNASRMCVQHSSTEVRRELGLGIKEALILHSGRMDRIHSAKRHDLLIEAVAQLSRTNHSIRCALLGDGPARSELEGIVKRLGVGDRIKLLGYRRDVADLLAAADLFVFPSQHEGMPIALMEAMWMGLPVVASDIPAHREVTSDGKFGSLIEPGSPYAFAREMDRLLRDNRARDELGLTARRYARETFSPERYARAMSGLWMELLADKFSTPCNLTHRITA